jgi:hypothetical protein
MTVVPAYGRDYPTAKAAVRDWLSGRDFIVQGSAGQPVSHRTVRGQNVTVHIRYRWLTMTAGVTYTARDI